MRRARRAGAAAPRGNPAGASVFCMAPLDPASAESDACIRANHAAWLAARGTRSITHEFKHRSRQEKLRWPPPGGLPQRPDVRRLEGRQELYIYYASACAYYYDGGLLRAARLSKPFAFAALKTGIALVCTSSTSAPELAAVLL